MIVKTDANLYPIDETVKKVPLQSSATVSIPASGTDSATINVPPNEMWFIKSWTITKGADVTVTSIEIDGTDTHQTTNMSDTLPQYGVLLNAESTVKISGTNAGVSAQSLGIQVDGYKIVF